MKEIGYLVKRNSLLFLRERSAVFFSLLSMLIVLALMVIFLGRMNSQALVDLLSEWGGERDLAADERNAAYLIQLWTLAGILVVNAVTVTLTVKSGMEQVLAADRTTSVTERGNSVEERTVVVNNGSGQEAVVRLERYPVFQGALVVSQGADRAEVRLVLTQAVSALTGLGADRITVCKGSGEPR